MQQIFSQKHASPSWATYFWPSSWFCLNISLTILNKAVFQFYKFHYPIVLSLVHMISTFIGTSLWLSKHTQFDKPVLNNSARQRLLTFSLLFSFNIIVGNKGLQLVDVSFLQVVRSMIPGITMLLSWKFLDKTYSKAKIFAILPICIGVSIATTSQVNVSPLGFFMSFFVCFLSSFKSVVTKAALTPEHLQAQISPIRLLNILSPLAAIVMLLFSVLFGELFSALNFFFSSPYGFVTFIWVWISGFLAFSLNVANFYATKLAGPLVITILGNIKHILTILISIIVFSTQITWRNALGILITISGAMYYSYLNHIESQQSRNSL